MAEHKTCSPGIAVLFLLVLTVGSCKKKSAPQPAPGQAAPPQSGVPVDPLPTDQAEKPAPVVPTFRYDAQDKRDPFRPYTDREPDIQALGCAAKFPRDNYKLVGILWGDVAMAAFEDPGGEGCFLRVGDRIGREKAVIREILFDHIVVVDKPLGIGPEIRGEMWLYEENR